MLGKELLTGPFTINSACNAYIESRISTSGTFKDDGNEDRKIQNLVEDYQSSVNLVQQLEEQEAKARHAQLSSPTSSETPSISIRTSHLQGYRSHATTRDARGQRDSVWFHALLFENSSVVPHNPGSRSHTWAGTGHYMTLEQMPQFFLRKWTYRGDQLEENQRKKNQLPFTHQPLVQNLQRLRNPQSLLQSTISLL